MSQDWSPPLVAALRWFITFLQETLPHLEFDLGGQTISLPPDSYIGFVTGSAGWCVSWAVRCGACGRGVG